MPRAPKQCGSPGCEERVVGRTYCAEHTPTTWDSYPSPNARAMTGAQRGRFAAAVLARDTVCRWPGCTRPATEADHVVSIGQGGDPHDPAGGAGLCREHHAAKTRAEAAEGRRRAAARGRRG